MSSPSLPGVELAIVCPGHITSMIFPGGVSKFIQAKSFVIGFGMTIPEHLMEAANEC